MRRDSDNRPRTPREHRDRKLVLDYMIPKWRAEGWRESEIAMTIASMSRYKTRKLADQIRLVTQTIALDPREGEKS